MYNISIDLTYIYSMCMSDDAVLYVPDLAGMSYTCTRIRVQFAIPMVFQKKLLLFCMFLISTQGNVTL